MSRTVLRFNDEEMACLYASVHNELCGLEVEIEDGTTAPEEVENAQRSIDTPPFIKLLLCSFRSCLPPLLHSPVRKRLIFPAAAVPGLLPLP